MSAITAPAAAAPTSAAPRSARTVADLLRDLGDIPPHRVRLDPPPGTATEADAYRVSEHERLCELIDGTLVEKTVGTPESMLALSLGMHLLTFVRQRKLGRLRGRTACTG